MTEPRTPEHLDKRLEHRADTPADKLPTYQELLDEAVEETFPASDPISPTAAMKTEQPVHTGMDHHDWQLRPEGSEPHEPVHVVAQFDDEAAARRARDEALADQLPTARLDLPAHPHDGEPAATLTLVACDDEQRERAMAIVRRSGAAHVASRP